MSKSFVYFFYWDECGFCEDFDKEVWKKIMSKKKTFPNVKFYKIESADLQKKEKEYMDENGKSFKSLLELEKIGAFPELKIVTPTKKVITFDGERNLESFTEWLQQHITKEKKGGGKLFLLGTTFRNRSRRRNMSARRRRTQRRY